MKYVLIGAGVAVFSALLGVLLYSAREGALAEDVDPTPRTVELSGTYVCLPHRDPHAPHTEECVFGLRTVHGEHYAVNFGASQDAAAQFHAGSAVAAEGFVIIATALSDSRFAAYDIKGMFTITKLLSATPLKIDIRVACEAALAFMTFPDGAAAEAFVAACVEGKHPEVVEQYKANLGIPR